jgi:hypothetical protein
MVVTDALQDEKGIEGQHDRVRMGQVGFIPDGGKDQTSDELTYVLGSYQNSSM